MDKIVCIGKNYDDHIKEIADPPTKAPVIFLKPPSVLRSIKNKQTAKLLLPSNQGEVHYETELVLRISKECYKIESFQANTCFDAVSIGLDMTLRELQKTQKKQGLPWTIGKVFPDSAICGEWILLDKTSKFEQKEFFFKLNDTIRQKGKADNMLWSCAKCIAYISQFFKLLPGDLVYTGTPSNTGAVKPGDIGHLKYQEINYSVEWTV